MTTPISPEEAVQRLEAGRKRLLALTNRTSTLNGQIAAAKAQLSELRAETEATYGSSDLDVLRQTFVQWQEENTAAVLKFEAELQAAEQQVTEVEQSLRLAGAQ